MIDAILERALPWGVFIGLGALIGAAFPRETRNAAKSVVRTGLQAAAWLSGVGAEAFEKGQDVFAEARLEYEQAVQEKQREVDRRRLRVVRPPRRSQSRSRANRTSGRSSRQTRGVESSAETS